MAAALAELGLSELNLNTVVYYPLFPCPNEFGSAAPGTATSKHADILADNLAHDARSAHAPVTDGVSSISGSKHVMMPSGASCVNH